MIFENKQKKLAKILLNANKEIEEYSEKLKEYREISDIEIKEKVNNQIKNINLQQRNVELIGNISKDNQEILDLIIEFFEKKYYMLKEQDLKTISNKYQKIFDEIENSIQKNTNDFFKKTMLCRANIIYNSKELLLNYAQTRINIILTDCDIATNLLCFKKDI
jgi:aspartyl/asparaginyl-tRNA synthetase